MVVADVVAWLRADGAVQHHIVLRYLGTGELCCSLDFAIAAPVLPADIDAHAEGIAGAFTEALNRSSAESVWSDEANGSPSQSGGPLSRRA